MIATRLINDCSHYHAGSRLVIQEIQRHMMAFGMQIAEPAQLVLVNGEGTLHHDTPGTSHILNELLNAPATATVAVINSVWQCMSKPLPRVGFAVARETFSAQEMRRDGMGAEVLTAPDISLCCQHRPSHTGGSGLLVIDSVSPAICGWLQHIAVKHGGRYLPLRDWQGTPAEFIDLLASHDRVITGRFHGVTLCMLAGVPFLAAPTNTWKTRGLLNDLGLEEHYKSTVESMDTAVLAGKFAAFDQLKLRAIDQQWHDIFTNIRDSCKSYASTKDQKMITGDCKSNHRETL